MLAAVSKVDVDRDPLSGQRTQRRMRNPGSVGSGSSIGTGSVSFGARKAPASPSPKRAAGPAALPGRRAAPPAGDSGSVGGSLGRSTRVTDAARRSSARTRRRRAAKAALGAFAGAFGAPGPRVARATAEEILNDGNVWSSKERQMLARIEGKEKFSRAKTTLLKAQKAATLGFKSYKAETAFRHMGALDKLRHLQMSDGSRGPHPATAAGRGSREASRLPARLHAQLRGPPDRLARGVGRGGLRVRRAAADGRAPRAAPRAGDAGAAAAAVATAAATPGSRAPSAVAARGSPPARARPASAVGRPDGVVEARDRARRARARERRRRGARRRRRRRARRRRRGARACARTR